MPEQRASERSERLNAAIDRAAAGRSTPSQPLGDPALDELLLLANRLRAELPRDLPDPRFRATLGAELTHGVARRHARPVSFARQHFPYLAAASAIAAVLVAAIAVGSYAVWGKRGSEPTPTQVQAVLKMAPQALTPTMVSAATGGSDVTSTADSRVMPAPTIATSGATVQPTATSGARAQPTVVPTVAVTTVPPTVVTSVATTPAIAPTATATPRLTASTPALAQREALPPVTGSSVETGGGPAADSGGGAPGGAIAVTLDTSMPALATTAPVYYLTLPSEDPAALAVRAAESVGIKGAVAEAPSVDGRHMQLNVDSAAGHFALTPDTGAFTFATIAPEGTPDTTLTEQDVARKTLDWLVSINYPVDSLGTPVVTAGGPGAWTVAIVASGVPGISVGKPTGVTLQIAADGRVASGEGYWLAKNREVEASLLSASDALEAVKAGEGYWIGGGGIALGGGAFRVTGFRLDYLLTSDGSGDLVVQPVVAVTGDFTAPDGSMASVTAYVQAVRAAAP